MQTKTRPDWHSYFYNIARAVAKRASCPRAEVGVVIVDADHRILATGYNGAPSGERDCLSFGCVVLDDHCQRSIHAEVNAVAYAARAGVSLIDSTMYVYSSRGDKPCRECLKLISSVRIKVHQQES